MSEALASLFRAGDSAPLTPQYSVGQIIAYNSANGASTVRVDTVDYVNLPILFEGGGYLVGQTVLVANAPGGPIILGRLITP